MTVTLRKSEIKMPLKCVVELCLAIPALEEMYEDVLAKADDKKLYDVRFEGIDWIKGDAVDIIRKHVEGDVVFSDEEFSWAYRFHDGTLDYSTARNERFKLEPLKRDNN